MHEVACEQSCFAFFNAGVFLGAVNQCFIKLENLRDFFIVNMCLGKFRLPNEHNFVSSASPTFWLNQWSKSCVI